MNKKILLLAVLFVALVMLPTQALAIGPLNAENNPNLDFPSYGVALSLDNGVTHEWVISAHKYLMYKDAREFKINTAILITDISQVAEFENKWLYFSATIFGDWVAFVLGVSRLLPNGQVDPRWIGIHQWAIINYPDGAYYREVIVGQ